MADMSTAARDYLGAFADKDIEYNDYEDFCLYILEKVAGGKENKCDSLISFYREVFALDEKAADRMLDTFVDSYVFCAFRFVDEDLGEECAEKIFSIPFRDKLINLFGRAATVMIRAENAAIRSKAFDVVKAIGVRDDIPEPFELFGNGVDETASAWHTVLFCRLCYAEALIEGDFEECDPVKGLSVLSDEFVTEEFYDDTVGISTQEYFDYMQTACDRLIRQKEYDEVFRALSTYPFYLLENGPKSECDEYLEEHAARVEAFVGLLDRENVNMATYDWTSLFNGFIFCHTEPATVIEKLYRLFLSLPDYAIASAALYVAVGADLFEPSDVRDRLADICRSALGRELSDREPYYDFLDGMSLYYLQREDTVRASLVLDGLDYADVIDGDADYGKLVDRRKTV